MKNLRQTAENIRKIWFEDRDYDTLHTFEKWGADGTSFVVRDKNGNRYRVTVTKEEENEKKQISDRSGQIFAFKTDVLEKDWTLRKKGTIFRYTFNTPKEGYFVGDEVVFVTEDASDVVFKNLYRINNISRDRKAFLFMATGDVINVHDEEKRNRLLQMIAMED